MGEYVGQRAAQAAQAVRRAGLRPGLNRSFGCEPELVGQVIAQEPAVGSELARNGLVTLYVAAPGAAPDELNEPAAEPQSAPGDPVLSEVQTPPAQPKARRRRKPGRAQSAPLSFGTPPAPTPPSPASGGGAWELPEQSPEDSLTAELELPMPRDGVALPGGPLEDGGAEDLAGEEFVVHADDVFAGRTEPAWRRVYPRRPKSAPRLGAWRSLFGERPVLVKAAGVLLAVWAVVALASAVAGSAGSTHRASAVAGLVHKHATRTASGPVPRAQAHRRAAIARPRRVLRSRHRRPARARPISLRPGRVHLRAVIPPRAAAVPVVSAPATRAPAPVRGQDPGGPVLAVSSWQSTPKEVRPVMALTLERAHVRQLESTAQIVLCVLMVLLCGAALIGVFTDGHLDALTAAGAFKGEAIGGVANFVDKLKGNLVWLGGTAMSLVIAVVGIMFMAGHSRAHDIAIRTIAGLAILASISGIVA